MKELNHIQQNLKAPKGQRNAFGNYNYRSCEDIVEAVKPLLNGCVLTISDDIKQLGDRYYVKATAILKAPDVFILREDGSPDRVIEGAAMTVSAFARESLDKKGMDSAQITGAASSYARKYALNGLFCIDDTKDADTQDNSHKPQQRQPQVNTGKPEDFIIKIGKNKGKRISSIDDMELLNFLTWITAQDDVKGELLNTKIAIDAYLKSKKAIK